MSLIRSGACTVGENGPLFTLGHVCRLPYCRIAIWVILENSSIKTEATPNHECCTQMQYIGLYNIYYNQPWWKIYMKD